MSCKALTLQLPIIFWFKFSTLRMKLSQIWLHHFRRSTGSTPPTFTLTSFLWPTFLPDGRIKTLHCCCMLGHSYRTNGQPYPNWSFLLIWWRRHHSTSVYPYCVERGRPSPNEIPTIPALFFGLTFSSSLPGQQFTYHFFFWTSTFNGLDRSLSWGMLSSWECASLWTIWSTLQRP